MAAVSSSALLLFLFCEFVGKNHNPNHQLSIFRPLVNAETPVIPIFLGPVCGSLLGIPHLGYQWRCPLGYNLVELCVVESFVQ